MLSNVVIYRHRCTRYVVSDSSTRIDVNSKGESWNNVNILVQWEIGIENLKMGKMNGMKKKMKPPEKINNWMNRINR